MKPPASAVSAELALGMALALESSESDIARVQVLLRDRADPQCSRELAAQLLSRALARIETVRLALDDASARGID